MAKVGPGRSVAVVGDGAVGLCGVIAAERLGAEQIIIMGRHHDRVTPAKESVPRTSSPSAVKRPSERARELTGGFGAHSVLECLGTARSTRTAIKITRPGWRGRSRRRPQ